MDNNEINEIFKKVDLANYQYIKSSKVKTLILVDKDKLNSLIEAVKAITNSQT